MKILFFIRNLNIYIYLIIKVYNLKYNKSNLKDFPSVSVPEA